MNRASEVEAATAARDGALEDVENAADPAWLGAALQAIRRTAERRADFISDDVWADAGLKPTHENRALGPVFQSAARNGWIKKTDRIRPSVRSHMSGKPVWQSLIYRGAR